MRSFRAQTERYCPSVSGARLHVFAWDDERQVWLARRDGEPSFIWATLRCCLAASPRISWR